MKRPIYRSIFAACAAIVSVASCVQKTKDIFEESSAERAQALVEQTRQYLLASAYGWVLEMYPGDDASHGGWNMTCRFDDDNVYVLSETDNSYTEETSSYTFLYENGPQIAFWEYNSRLHYFAQPSSSTYQAQRSDFQYTITAAEEGLISLRANRTGNRAYLRKLDIPAEDYMRQVKSMQTTMSSTYTGKIGSEEVSFWFYSSGGTTMASRDFRVTTYDEETDEEGNVTRVPVVTNYVFIFTPTGVRFYEPVTIGGTTMTYLDYDADNWQFSSDGSIDIAVEKPEGAVPLSSYAGRYTLTYRAFDAGSGNAKPTASNLHDGPLYSMDVELVRISTSQFALKGLNPKWDDILLDYNFNYGQLELTYQPLGQMENGNYVHLWVWTTRMSDYYRGSSYGARLAPGENDGTFSFDFFGTINPDLFFLAELRSASGGSDSYSYYINAVTDPQWTLNGSAWLTDITLTRK